MNVFQFGRELIKTGDLDPVYIVLHKSYLTHTQMQRYLLAYWCYYHMGTAAWITGAPSEQKYWERMGMAARSKEYPRCSERRHFRGNTSIKSTEYLKERGIDDLFKPFSGSLTLGEVMTEVKSWYGFGDWISFKVADMLERLGICEVEFKPEDIFSMFDSPVEGAEIVATELGLNPYNTDSLNCVYKKITKEITEKAPPGKDRPINIQEVETILCKYKSHTKGKYNVGHDIAEIKEALQTEIGGKVPRLSYELYEAAEEAKLW